MITIMGRTIEIRAKTAGIHQQTRSPDSSLLGLIGEQVSDLTYVQAEQLVASPVQLPQMPFFDAIVQTGGGIVQLIAVERLRDASLRGNLPALDALLNQQSLADEAPKSEYEDSKSEN